MQQCMNSIFETIRNAGLKLTDKNFCLGCKRVDYNAGVEEFLEMLKANGIRNYLLSSGLKIFLENVSIAPCFEKILRQHLHITKTVRQMV